MQKNINIYIYIADASADASLPRFLENDASAASLPKNAPASCNIGPMTKTKRQMPSTCGCTWRQRQQRNKTWKSSTTTGWWGWHGCYFIFLSHNFCFQLFKMYSAILQIIVFWVVVPNFICWILISPITVMTQQPQVVVHINQAFCPFSLSLFLLTLCMKM